MSKKILISLSVIGLVAAIVIGATTAYFSDTETSKGNTFTAGTVDIAVNGQNPWNEEGYFTISDMKPCQVEYKEFTLKNVGQNEVDVWKHIDITSTDGGEMSEPECKAECELVSASGYNYDNGTCTCVGEDHQPVDNIAEKITYDLVVNGETIISEDDGVKMSNVNCCWIYLGKIEPQEEMTVVQSYHMDADAGNEYQGDQVNFTVELYAQQIKGCPPAPGTECKIGDKDYGKPVGDFVDIGNPFSERGHLTRVTDDWSFVGSQSCTGGPEAGCLKLGDYGGYDPDDPSHDFRGLMGPDTGCNSDHAYATLVMNACNGPVTKLILRHLDGIKNDSFEVYYNDSGTWKKIGDYTWQGAPENWVTTSYDLPGPREGKLEFKIVATDPVTEWCEAGWGQVMINWAKVE